MKKRNALAGRTAAVSLVLAAGVAAYAQTSKERKMPASAAQIAKTSPPFNSLTPEGYKQVSTRDVTVDGERATLTRFERQDGRNAGLGGEHYSRVVNEAGLLKGFANMDLAYESDNLPSRERTREIAMGFLKEFAPDLLPRMEISWIEPHDEPVRVTRDGRPQVITVTGMKVKMRNTGDGRWFWVIVGANERVMVFERDIVWINMPGHRQTEKWLHDTWLAARDSKNPAH
ncbi:hypothetical protein JY651_05025 [Pyxidicoccus parkwayensis]|uniref:Lipoprotein n=1 Tax=Pyxidicoccus parkwayensis TaxID=2813578 RepID=A0ABX7NZH0_9BACT|nr:hypothetical protein [Pyxidicoccus parkwaysis]QSQ24330.1 hypothetical protein JY651_05025 [Pyxidicoccus parkwaysis]